MELRVYPTQHMHTYMPGRLRHSEWAGQLATPMAHSSISDSVNQNRA